jgi:hypothetical protein
MVTIQILRLSVTMSIFEFNLALFTSLNRCSWQIRGVHVRPIPARRAVMCMGGKRSSVDGMMGVEGPTQFATAQIGRVFLSLGQFTVNVATLLFCPTTAPDESFTVPCTVYVPAAEGVKFRLLWCVLPVDILALVECVATTAPDEFTT